MLRPCRVELILRIMVKVADPSVLILDVKESMVWMLLVFEVHPEALVDSALKEWEQWTGKTAALTHEAHPGKQRIKKREGNPKRLEGCSTKI